LDGGSGEDELHGGNGNDVLRGNLGRDVLSGDAGNDRLDGGDCDDVLHGGDGDDVLCGDAGDDLLQGNAGNDTVEGGDGNDVMADGAGSDVVHGGAGDDHLNAAMDAASDYYAGDAGEDTLDYSAAVASVEIDMGAGTAHGSEIGDDVFTGFESIVGGHGDDHLRSGSGSSTMTGGAGSDIFEFETPDQSRLVDLVRKITDFTVGDRLLVAQYEIQERSGGGPGSNDWFENVYLSSDETQHRAIRFRFERYDDRDTTVVDVQDGAPENIYSIELLGYHQLEAFNGIS
jgi:Ca2+-binding RTX toxin-like protein